MSIYHCSIKIISRAGGRSAVASAAYRSGERYIMMKLELFMILLTRVA